MMGGGGLLALWGAIYQSELEKEIDKTGDAKQRASKKFGVIVQVLAGLGIFTLGFMILLASAT